MNTTQTAQAITAAVAQRTELVKVAMAAKPGRAAKVAWAAVEVAEQAVRFAVQDHEMAVRASMLGATEADIQTAARAA